MNTKTKIFYCITSAVLFLILFLQHAIKLTDLRFYLIGAILIGYIYYSEDQAQKRRMLNWDTIRTKGKTRFILVDYVILRGVTFSLLLTLILSINIAITLLIICSILPLLGVMVFVGNEVWKQCEQSYSIARMNSVAEKIKILQN